MLPARHDDDDDDCTFVKYIQEGSESTLKPVKYEKSIINSR